MSFFNPLEFILHIDAHIGTFIQTYGSFTYLILFLIIFLETGFVIAPFLPGDSLLFVTGAFAAQGAINIFYLFILFSLAAILGDSFNYYLGNVFGERIFRKSRFFKKEYLEMTEKFYHKHGGRTIIFARFIPVIRTFAPFVAGIGKMNYKKFIAYNIIGGLAWVSLFLIGGYYFGTIQFVKDNLTFFILLIIVISIIPAIIEYIMARRAYKKEKIETNQESSTAILNP